MNIKPYLSFKTACSAGPGGQHVNKTETKVIATLDVKAFLANELLDAWQKDLILEQLGDTFTTSCQETRSQFQNKGICEDKILRKLTHLLQPPKIRKAPRKNKAADAKRRRDKLHHKLKKENRNLSLLEID